MLQLLFGQLAVLLFVAVGCGVASAAPKRVLLLHSFGLDAPPWSEYSKHLRSELSRKLPNDIDLFEVTLETARLPGEPNDAPFADYLAALFRKRAPDLIITVAAPAARFVQQHRKRLFPTTPALITGLEQRRYALGQPNEVGVLSAIDFFAVMQNIIQVLPKTEHIAIVLGASPIERYWKEQLRIAVEPLNDRIAFSWFNDLSFGEMEQKISALPPQSAIFFGALAVDAKGVPLIDGQVFARFRDLSNAPMFGYEDTYFGRGVVGGPMLSISDISRRAVESAVRILAGTELSRIQTEAVGFAPPRFDWREMQRWKIRESDLPSGSQIEFREPSFLSQHRWTVVGIGSVLVLQALLISALLFERFRRRRAEAAARRRLLELTQMNRSLTVSAMSNSIAHELNQPLGAILNNAGAAQVLLAKHPPDIDQLKEILADIRKDDERAGEIISNLRGFLKTDDTAPGEVNISQAIADVMQIVEPEAAKRGIAIDCEQASRPLAVYANHVHLQQVLLNLALNGMDAMREVTAGRQMTFQTSQVDEAKVEIAVLDRGTGIPEARLKEIFDSFVTTKQHGTGLGLSIARTIVELYGGRIWAENREHGGAAFRLVLPMAKSTA